MDKKPLRIYNADKEDNFFSAFFSNYTENAYRFFLNIIRNTVYY